MREHAVPQNVTSYEFHLIGNMTLKQFLELAAGIVLAVIIYKTNLPDLIKIPIAIVVAGVGAMIAFVPFEGRPLDQWFIAFVKAIYKPTEYYWKKTSRIPDYFTYTPLQDTNLVEEVDLAPYRKQRIMEFIDTLPAPEKIELLNLEEAQKINTLTALFDEVEVHHDVITATPLEPEKPSVVPETHVLKPLEKLQTEPLDFEALTEQEQPQDQSSITSTTGVTIPHSLTPDIPDQQTVVEDNIPSFEQSSVDAPLSQTPAEQASSTGQEVVKKQVTIPEHQTILVDQTTVPAETALLDQDQINNPVDVFSTVSAPVQQQVATQQATTSNTLPFPQKPTSPNVVTGMVFDTQGKIVDNAIVEITDSAGLPVRAVKTNSIGQFFVTTPLKDGSYIVTIEKEGHQFPTLSIDLQETLLDPLTITATA